MTSIHMRECTEFPNQVFTDHETFGRLVTLSMPLSTEPEEERLKSPFHSLAEWHGTSKDFLRRLIWIVDEYNRRGLPQEDGDDRKCWHTSNFLRMLIAFPHDRVLAKERVRMGQESLEWVQEQVHEILRPGIDLHQRVGNVKLLDFLQYPKRHPESFDNEAEPTFSPGSPQHTNLEPLSSERLDGFEAAPPLSRQELQRPSLVVPGYE